MFKFCWLNSWLMSASFAAHESELYYCYGLSYLTLQRLQTYQFIRSVTSVLWLPDTARLCSATKAVDIRRTLGVSHPLHVTQTQFHLQERFLSSNNLKLLAMYVLFPRQPPDGVFALSIETTQTVARPTLPQDYRHDRDVTCSCAAECGMVTHERTDRHIACYHVISYVTVSLVAGQRWYGLQAD